MEGGNRMKFTSREEAVSFFSCALNLKKWGLIKLTKYDRKQIVDQGLPIKLYSKRLHKVIFVFILDTCPTETDVNRRDSYLDAAFKSENEFLKMEVIKSKRATKEGKKLGFEAIFIVPEEHKDAMMGKDENVIYYHTELHLDLLEKQNVNERANNEQYCFGMEEFVINRLVETGSKYGLKILEKIKHKNTKGADAVIEFRHQIKNMEARARQFSYSVFTEKRKCHYYNHHDSVVIAHEYPKFWEWKEEFYQKFGHAIKYWVTFNTTNDRLGLFNTTE